MPPGNAPSAAFPIPMRGNEMEQHVRPVGSEAVSDPHAVGRARQLPREVRFPIPMRGNEYRATAPGVVPAKVSDPHEG